MFEPGFWASQNYINTMIGGTKFPADIKITCTKPALPNRRRVTLFLSTFAAQTHIHRETKERPFGLSPLRSGAVLSANQNLWRAVLVSREIGSRYFADIIWRLKPWHKHLDM